MSEVQSDDPARARSRDWRLHHAEHWPIGTLARQLRVHHSTVRRVLAQAGVPVLQPTVRASLIDPYRAFINHTLTAYPTLRVSRLYQRVHERGYPGAPDHFRALIARLRPRPVTEAYLRLRALPIASGADREQNRPGGGR